MALDKASTALVVGLKKDLVDKIKTKHLLLLPI